MLVEAGAFVGSRDDMLRDVSIQNDMDCRFTSYEILI
jgi:hypothetical protein